MRDLNLTLLQTPLCWQDPAANRSAFSKLIEKEAKWSDLVVLPETFTTGFTMNTAEVGESENGDTVSWLLEMAELYAINICGSVIITEGSRHYNRLLWANPAGELFRYDKRHLFTMGGESDAFVAGDERLVVSMGDWRICPLICYDLRFPVWSRNQGDYDLLLYVANWPETRKSAWETLLPARAVENLCYVAGVNRTGVDGNGIKSAGGSLITDYLGHVIAAADDQPVALKTRLSLDKLQRYRKKFPAWQDADNYEILPR